MIREIPVIKKPTKCIKYVYHKKANKIVEFAFDWSLIDRNILIKLFKRYDVIYSCGINAKTEGIIRLIENDVNIKILNSLDQLSENSDNALLISYNKTPLKFIKDNCTIQTIDELYLCILGLTSIEYLRRQKVPYYFFQTTLSLKK